VALGRHVKLSKRFANGANLVGVLCGWGPGQRTMKAAGGGLQASGSWGNG